MIRDALSQTDLLELPLIAFAIFLVTFAIVVGRVLLRGRGDHRDEALSRLPLTADAADAADVPDPIHPEHDRE